MLPSQFWFLSLQQFICLGEVDKQCDVLYYNPRLNVTVSSKSIKIKEINYDKAFEISQWRFLTQYSIAKIYHGHVIKQTRNGCYINVLVDHFDLLFQDLHNIPLSQSLYILRTTIVSLEKLVEKFGYFDLTSKMIGITKNKQCKVWINQDLTSFSKMKECLNEQIMLCELFHMVQQHTQKDDTSNQFFSLAINKCTSFIKSQNFISHYAFQEQIIIPHLFIEDRRKSIDPFLMNRLNLNNRDSKLFFSNQTSLINYNYNQNNQEKILFNLKNQEKSKRKSELVVIRREQAKGSFIKHGSMTPTQISFTYQSSNGNKVNGSRIFKSPVSNTSIFKQHRVSRQMFAKSARNSPENVSCSKSQPYLGTLGYFNTKDSIVSECNKDFTKINDQKKMSIISTLSLKINSQPNLFSPKNTSRIDKELQQQQQNTKMIKKLFEDNFQTKEWKNTISQLFSSDKNLKQSMSYGQQQKAYLKDIDLKKLNKFGRFIATSVLERDQDQQSQYIGQFKKFAN